MQTKVSDSENKSVIIGMLEIHQSLDGVELLISIKVKVRSYFFDPVEPRMPHKKCWAPYNLNPLVTKLGFKTGSDFNSDKQGEQAFSSSGFFLRLSPFYLCQTLKVFHDAIPTGLDYCPALYVGVRPDTLFYLELL